MNDREAVAWLYRRAGFGLPADAMATAVARAPQAELRRLMALATGPAPADPWDDAQLPYDPKDQQARLYAIGTWLASMIDGQDPLRDRMAWCWHGHFVSAIDKVRAGRLMVDQIRLFRTAGLGHFGPLLRAVTVDPAMLIYLDGGLSTAAAPNENYGREVMELFTLGVGNYTEDDVKAAARALTGYRMRPRLEAATFVAGNHDDRPQHYLGTDGVHDVDTVVAALLAHPALPTFIAGTLSTELLGTTDPSVVAPLADTFVKSSFDIGALVAATLTAGLAGVGREMVLAPVPWFVIASRVTGAAVPVRQALNGLRAAAQVPMLPPNVAGWPGGQAWFASGTVVARANLAMRIAAAAPANSTVVEAATAGDLDALAGALGMISATFETASKKALGAATTPRQRLALALISPEFVIS
jgi:uncharacterized protein (DUF1800 family)